MTLKIVKHVLFDILQSRTVVGYAGFLLAVSTGLFRVSDDAAKGLVGLLNVVLTVVPLVSTVFATVHFYNASEFVELLAAQPLRRSAILWGEFVGAAGALAAAILLGLGLPILLFSPNLTGLFLLLAALALNKVFVAIALLVFVCARDKARGIGAALLVWFFFSVLYDALVLLLMFGLADWPLEQPMLALTALNPIDLARVAMLLQMDSAALMGYTGALFRDFLGTGWGIAVALLLISLWVLVPLGLALRVFRRKDL